MSDETKNAMNSKWAAQDWEVLVLPPNAPPNYIGIPLDTLPSNEELSSQDPDAGLVASVRDLGILEPILVTQQWDGSFKVAAGVRRIKAARAVGHRIIVARVLEDGEEQGEGGGTASSAPSGNEDGRRGDEGETRKRVDMIIAERMRMRRGELGWYQQDLADRIGVTRAQVSSWESGRVSVYAGDLPRLGRVLGVPPVWFLGRYAGTADPVVNALNELDSATRDGILAQIQFHRNRGQR